MNQRLIEGARKTKTNFIFREQIAKGQYGPIWLVERMPDREKLVIKEMSKLDIYRLHAVDTVINEQRLMQEMMSPFLGNMRYAFQDT